MISTLSGSSGISGRRLARLPTLALAAALAASPVLAPSVARAQPFAMALGHPLPAKDTPAGSVVVRLIAGAIGKPVIGAEVTLLVNNAPRVARTDDAGRATFADLPAGATVQVKIVDEDKQDVTSDQFPVAADVGTRVLMSTRPMGGGGGGMPGGGGNADTNAGPMQGGAGGPMIEPRQASGQPRLEQTYEKGTLTAVVVYDDFAAVAPNIPVSLVGYASDDSITVQTKATDDKGRAEFRNLDVSGNITYFVLSEIPRNGALDRVYGRPLELDTHGGVHMILSAAKRDATDPPVDDFATVQKQDKPTDAGKVRVAIQGPVEFPAKVSIYDAATHQVVASANAERLAVDPVTHFQSSYGTRKDIDPGIVGVVFHGGPAGQADNRLAGAKVHLVDTTAAPDAPADPALAETTSNADGEAVFRLPAASDKPRKLKALIDFNNARYTSDEFTLETANGGVLEVVAQWDAKGRVEAMIDVPHIAGRVLYAEAINQTFRYRSAPFQTIPTAGTQVQMFFYPRTLMTFRLAGSVDDMALGVQGTFTVTNYSWAPFAGSPDGTIVPLPKGFKGVVVAEGDQEMVATDPGEGFRIVRPIPPGGTQFHGGFSLPLDGDTVHWAMDLPYGAIESSLKVLKTPDMKIDAPLRVDSTVAEGFGPIYALEGIRIMPRQSMVMTLSGLPHAPSWRVWIPRVLGLVVIAMIVTGIAFALSRPAKAAAGSAADEARARREARREALLELLVELEREAHANGGVLDDKQKRRRDTMITELEALWGDD